VEGTAEVVSAATALLTVGGVTQAAVTNLQFTVDGNQKVAEPVVGNVQRPDVFVGKVKVSGTFTAYYDTTVLRDAFINETQTSLLAVLANGTGAAADFQAFTINNMNVNSTTPDDQETGLKRTYAFVAEYNNTGGAGIATELTTLQVQDSLAA
jgi:hypothetical protein